MPSVTKGWGRSEELREGHSPHESKVRVMRDMGAPEDTPTRNLGSRDFVDGRKGRVGGGRSSRVRVARQPVTMALEVCVGESKVNSQDWRDSALGGK